MQQDRKAGSGPARQYSVSLQQAAAAVFGNAVIDGGAAQQEQMSGTPRARPNGKDQDMSSPS